MLGASLAMFKLVTASACPLVRLANLEAGVPHADACDA